MILVGFSGRAGTGKSTAARHLVEHHGFVRRPFAAPLKGMLRALFHAQGVPAAEVERMIDGDLKERPARTLDGCTPRVAMQTLGTEWGRALSPALWVNSWTRSLDGLERVVADDVRFENEAAAMRRLGGRVIEVCRPGLVRRGAAHASEAGVIADAMLPNADDPAALWSALDLWLGLAPGR